MTATRPNVCALCDREGFEGNTCPCYGAAFDADSRLTYPDAESVVSTTTHEHHAYDYIEQRWTVGSTARALLIQQARDELAIVRLEGATYVNAITPRGQFPLHPAEYARRIVRELDALFECECSA